MTEIKLGDKIYLKDNHVIRRIETVTRLTKTMVRSENYNYSYPDERGHLRIKGQQGNWFTLRGWLETPELAQEWEEKQLRNWMENNYRNIPISLIRMLKSALERKQ